MKIDGKDCDRGKRGGGRPGQGPTRPPEPALGDAKRFRAFFFGRLRERDHGAALRADGQMTKHLFSLMRGQSLLDEGADLVRVWMLPELKRFAHREPDAGIAV
jgi:hypothetical protein